MILVLANNVHEVFKSKYDTDFNHRKKKPTKSGKIGSMIGRKQS